MKEETREYWELPDCEGRKCRWLESRGYSIENGKVFVVIEEHWTSSLEDNRGCYLKELIYTETKC